MTWFVGTVALAAAYVVMITGYNQSEGIGPFLGGLAIGLFAAGFLR